MSAIRGNARRSPTHRMDPAPPGPAGRAFSRTAHAVGCAVLLLASGCARRETPKTPAPDSAPDSMIAARETTAVVPATPAPDTVRVPRYTRFAVRTPKRLRAFQDSLGAERFAAVLKLNRVDLGHVRDRDSLVVPDSLSTLRELSPFPLELPHHRDLHKLLLVSLAVQAFAAYDSGALARWGPTSTGRETLATPSGLYHTNWKDKERISTFNDEWQLKWYVNLQNFVGISLHEYELPGYPASHSCVRLNPDDAEWLYGWSEQWVLDRDPRRIVRHGTPVVIFGAYAFRHRPPWKRLPEDSTATALPLETIEEALRQYLPADSGRVAGPITMGPPARP